MSNEDKGHRVYRAQGIDSAGALTSVGSALGGPGRPGTHRS